MQVPEATAPLVNKLNRSIEHHLKLKYIVNNFFLTLEVPLLIYNK